VASLTPQPAIPPGIISYNIQGGPHGVLAGMTIDDQGVVTSLVGQEMQLTPEQLQELKDLFQTSGFFNMESAPYLHVPWAPAGTWVVSVMYHQPDQLPFEIHVESGIDPPSGFQILVAHLADILAQVMAKEWVNR
jgi:hypothetical protein